MAGKHEMIPSPDMGRNVHVWKYGYFGLPVVIFPTAAGFAHEWQAQGMIDVLAPLIGSGRIKLYCPESNVSEAWTKKEVSPALRMEKHAAYERFVMNTLVPYIRDDCRSANIPIGTAGCSLGAMYSALMALKNPETFDYALCMSGRYLATVFTEGFVNEQVYFNSPLHFVPRLDAAGVARLQKTHLTLVCGQGKYEEGCIEETIELAALLGRKGVPHTRDIWGKDVSHNWEWWKHQAALHLGRRYGR